MSAPSFAPEDPRWARLLELLAIERKAEVQHLREGAGSLPIAEREARGDVVVKLRCVEEETGLSGRTLLSLERASGLELPPDAPGPGDPVALVPPSDDASLARAPRPQGIVFRRSARRIVIAIEDEAPEWVEGSSRLSIERLADATTHERLQSAVERVRRAKKGERLAELRDIASGARGLEKLIPPASTDEDALIALDDSQKQAVRSALTAPEFALIHGPPGTGKTTAVVALVRAAVARGEKVLVCAASNAAVDVVCERLIAAGLAAVRVGHPARVSAALFDATLDERVRASDDAKVARDLFREADQIRRKLQKWSRAAPGGPAGRRALRDEMKALITDARRAADTASERILDAAPAVCSTLTGVDGRALEGRRFDLVVIDEAAQALEPACWIAIARARKVVLAGDHKQLPPTVLAPEAARGGLSETLFERLHRRFAEERARMLTVQYRMHETIAGFSSDRFYDGKIRAASGNAAHLLRDLPGVREHPPWTGEPLLLFDTSGTGAEEAREGGGASIRNEREADLVARVVAEILSAGVPAADIGVISPYSAQVALLRERLADEVARGLEIGTADGFQGREREAIVLSLTRANDRGEVGFLSDHRRANVALTRARRAMVIVGDGATLGGDSFYADLFAWCDAAGGLRSAWELT